VLLYHIFETIPFNVKSSSTTTDHSAYLKLGSMQFRKALKPVWL